MPFEKLVEELQPERDLSRSPLFQAMFALQNTPQVAQGTQSGLELPGLRLSGVGGESATAKFDLSAEFSEDRQGQLHYTLTYATSLFDRATIERMGQHLQRLLEAVAETAEQKLGAVSILTEAEQAQLRDWAVEAVAEVPTQCVHELFEVQVARTPDASAVVSGSDELTYGELNRRANQLAHYLRRQGVGPEVVVGLCLERSVEMVVGLLGILKAGGAYLPLDPTYPRQRLEYMFSDAQVGLVLTQRRLREQLPAHWGQTIAIDDEWSDDRRRKFRNPTNNNNSRKPCLCDVHLRLNRSAEGRDDHAWRTGQLPAIRYGYLSVYGGERHAAAFDAIVRSHCNLAVWPVTGGWLD